MGAIAGGAPAPSLLARAQIIHLGVLALARTQLLVGERALVIAARLQTAKLILKVAHARALKRNIFTASNLEHVQAAAVVVAEE